MALVQKLVVVGGNGFLGSAVCKAALGKGMQVTSISSSGKPFTTPKGHSPAWTSKVDWQRGNAFDPQSYSEHLHGATAVVHTLGTLFEGQQYKKAIKDGDLPALFANIFEGFGSKNPLESNTAKESSYETVNRDTALRVCETFLATPPPASLSGPRAFVYVSAEDVFRPWISEKYIQTKREAESRIDQLLSKNTGVRGVYMRPSLIYHPHFRPITSPFAAAIDLSATVHSRIPYGFPTPSGALRTLSKLFPTASPIPSPFESMANALTIPPIHVDHVAQAIALAADNERLNIQGVQGVSEMRQMFGWPTPEYSYSH